MEKNNQKKGKRTQRDYTLLAFKLQVIQEVEIGDLTYKQAQKKYGIQGRSTSTVLTWLRKYGKLNWCTPNKAMIMHTSNQKIKELEAKLAEAEKKANEAEHKAALLDTLIDVAEGQFGYEIRKSLYPNS